MGMTCKTSCDGKTRVLQAWSLKPFIGEGSEERLGLGDRMVDRVGWGSAFGKGVVVLLWMIVWVIIGLIITGLIAGGVLFSALQNPLSLTSNPLAFIGTILLALVVGELFITIASFATIVKTAANAAIAKVEQDMGRPMYQETKPGEKPGY